MPAITVSIPEKLFKIMRERSISQSQAAQLGIQIAAAGGVESFREEIREEFREQFEEQEQRFKDMEERLRIKDEKLQAMYAKEAREFAGKLKEEAKE